MKDKADTVNPNGSFRQALTGRSVDIAVAIAGFLVFLIFMFLLGRWLFPTGSSLRDDAAGLQETRNDESRRELSYSGDNEGDDAFVASVISISRNVQTKGRQEIAWRSAREGQQLVGRDSLQTKSNSRATVRLADDSVIRVGADSLIVFQTGLEDLFTRRRTNSIVMMSGSLAAEFEADENNPLHLEIALPNGLARFIPGDGHATVAFDVQVNPDQSSSVSVHSGTGVITVGGNTATVDATHGITISINGKILEEGRLPGPPGGFAPRNGTVYRYRALPPAVDFSWDPAPHADRYRFRLARDAVMDKILVDERIGERRFEYGGLGDGVYYWQVSAITGLIEGRPAAPRRLEFDRDEQPPLLRLESPEILAGASAAVVRGLTDDSASVYVQGEAIATVAGRFEHRVPIEPGTTLIVVEAVDSAGNVAYDSHLINTNSTINGGGR